MSILKSKRAINIMALSFLIYAIPIYFSQDWLNVHKVDIYLLSDKLRYPENIAYDIAELLTINLLIYAVYSLIQYRQYKRYALAFMITSLLGIPAYFLIYSQGSTLFILPLLIALLYVAHRKNRNEEGNNIR